METFTPNSNKQFSRKFQRLLLLLCCFLISLNCFSQTIVERHGHLKVEGNRIVNKEGEAVQLRGMSLFWSQWMGQYYNYDAVKWLRDDWGATVVRAAMAVEEGGYATNPEVEKAKIMTVVEAAIDLGIYVIIDFHVHEGAQHQAEALEFFAEMSRLYGDAPNVIYEVWNEPSTHSWLEVIRPYHETVIGEIRKHDPDNIDNIIVCGTRNWSQYVDEAALYPIRQNNIAYTLHYYAATHKQSLREKAKVAMDAGIALFVTEYGTPTHTGDGEIDEAEVEAWWDFLDEHKISHANWSIADKEETSAALKPGASATGGWPLDMLTPSGLMVRNELRNKMMEDLTAPEVSSPVAYCQGAEASPLSAAGTNLKWYTVATDGTASTTAPTPSTATSGITNYYVSQSMNGFEGPRAKIEVSIDQPLGELTATGNWAKSFSFNTTSTFSVIPLAGATDYLWTVPAGFEIVSGKHTNSIDVKATSGIASGEVSVSAANGCGAGEALVADISATKASASVVFPALQQEYSGEPVPVTVTTEPEGLTVDVKYNGSSEVPVEVGEYELSAVIVDDNYFGEASGVFVISTPTAVQNQEKLKAILLYPSPTTGKATLEIGEATSGQVTIMDLAGQVIIQATAIESYEVNLEGQAPGMYFIKVQSNGNSVTTLKVVKQ